MTHARYIRRRTTLCVLVCLLAVSGLGVRAAQADSPVLALGVPLQREMKGGESHRFRLALSAGQYVRVVVEQQGIDVAIALVAPNGERVMEVDSPNGNRGPEPISAVVAQAGEYAVEVRAPNKNALPGAYEIKLEAVREPTSTDRTQADAERDFREAQKLARQPTADARRSALEKFAALIPVFRALEDRPMEVLTLNTAALGYHATGELTKALAYYAQAVPLSRALGYVAIEAALLNNIGGVYDILGEPQKAFDYYWQALPLWRSLQNNSGEGDTLNNIGVIYFSLGEVQKALEYYQQALPLRQASGNKRREADTLDNIGIVYRVLGDPPQAFEYLQRALELRREVKDVAGEANSLHYIGYTYAAMDEPAKALDYYERALPLRRTAGDRRGEAVTLNAEGEIYALRGEIDKAFANHQQALELLRAVGDRRLEAVTQTLIGNIHALSGRSQEAVKDYADSISIFELLGAKRDEAWARQGLARAERDRGNFAEARRQIEISIALVEAMRIQVSSRQLRASYLATKQNAYEFYTDLLMLMHLREPAKGHDATAFQISERARARGFREMLTESGVDLREGVDPALLDRERELSQVLNAKAERLMRLRGQRNTDEQVAALKKEVSALENEYQQVQGDIRRRSPRYAAITQPATLALPEVQQQLLDRDTMLLEYSLGTERSYLWAITQNSCKSYLLPARDQIEQSARRVYGLVRARSVKKKNESETQRRERIRRADSELTRAATALGEMVLGPVAAQLGSKRLAVVADGMLQYIPFAMLPVPDARNRSVYQPLIVKHEIVTLASASALAVQRKERAGRKMAPRDIAVIADPVFDVADPRVNSSVREQARVPDFYATRIVEHLSDGEAKLRIPRLPYTRQEAERILSVMPRGENLKAVDFNAQRAAALGGELREYRYIHFATHGYIDSEKPGLSAIVLSLVDERGQARDGFLRAQEIYNLQLPAELVVLSACQTGLGREIKGEGLVGLTRGFMYAGAPRVIVSLWSVSDRGTADLMGRLYAEMIKNGQRPAAALRSAQFEMWRQKGWRSPYYWAAFVQQGEWR
ncbi:MAG TPA: tetratricopeptide repeat protein [Pyrinomonadaceae bacterium]|nr:tetratricopeptide repeat protein [Pyrinomonadaceae bacterium]